jgi:manganese oxidase
VRFFLIATLFFAMASSIAASEGSIRSQAAQLQAIQANDNRVAAGRLFGSELRVSLEARLAMWYPDGDSGPGIPIEAFAERGKPAQIPGPLFRVPAGTMVIATVHDSIPGVALTMHGMVSRPTTRDRAVRIAFGQTRVIRFRAGSPGTYLYWGATRAKTFGHRIGVDSQLSGAFVVDPSSRKLTQHDRIFVIGGWINVLTQKGAPDFDYELGVINGRAWPHTERLTYQKNSTVRWRWINASGGTHPLHLHGFYFSVGSRGDGLADNIYKPADEDRQVTEAIEPGSTFTMTWHADRPGNWLFHCHLAYHITGHMPIREMLAGKSAMTEDTYENDFVRRAGMGGLILGLTVRDPSSQLAAAPAPPIRRIQLKVETAPDDRPDAPSFRYVVNEGNGFVTEPGAIGPPIVLTKGVSSTIDVTNLLKEPTAVHWHGVELADSYYDGVVGFSGSGTRVAPMIEPGQTFEVRMTPPRAGTFIYHTHMDDVFQLRGGLAGPLIVLEPGTSFDPRSDHVFTITTTHTLSDALKIFVNGSFSPAAITCHVGTPQRFRFINMTTFWTNAIVSLIAGNRTVQWRPLEIDGAYVSEKHRTPEPAVEMVTIGQTRDYTFMPTQAGNMELQFLPDPSVPHAVTVPIHVVQ